MDRTAVSIRNLDFAYEGAGQTLTGIGLDVPRGSCTVLMGASGSGKTTIIRTINGLAGGYYRGTATGEMTIQGTDASSLPAWQRARLVGSVFQDPASQFFSSQLAGEVAFGCENLGMDRDDVVRRTDGAIALLGIDDLRPIPLDALSSGQKQKCAIASAIAPEPGIIVMDEPSANLDEPSARDLGRTLARLKRAGHTLIVAEHRIAYLMDVADTFHFVEGGRIAGTLAPGDVLALADGERRARGVRSPHPVSRRPLPPPEAATPAAGGHVLDVRGIDVTLKGKAIMENARLRVAGGQIVALTGPNGIGKTTFARAVAGLARTRRETVLIDGKRVSRRARRRAVWYSPNDVSAEFFTASVADEVMLQVDATDANLEHARGILRRLDLYHLKDRHPAALSGGQKQRLSIACGLVQRRPVLILDEPTSGLDAINMARLADALRLAAAQGCAVIVITHDNEFINECCTHLAEFDPGPGAAAAR